MRGILAGSLALIALHALVARANQKQLEGLTGLAVQLVQRIMDPTIPAIADHSAPATTAATSPPASSSSPKPKYPSPNAGAGSGSGGGGGGSW